MNGSIPLFAMTSLLLSLPSVAYQTAAYNYCEISGCSLMWYDYILTLPYEIRYFWGRRLSWTGALFFLNRYLILITSTFSTAAQLVEINTLSLAQVYDYYFPIFAAIAQLFVTDLIVCVRLYAIYGGSKKVVWYMLGLLFLCMCTLVGLLVGVVAKATGSAGIQGSIQDHHFVFDEQVFFLWTVWLPILVYESTAFGMVLYKAYQYLRNRRFLRAMEEHTGAIQLPRVITVLYRDSVMYFTGLLALFVIGLVFASLPGPTGRLNGITVSLSSVLAAVMNNRMLFNLRYQDAMDLKGTTGLINTTTFRHVSVQFAANGDTGMTTSDGELL